jgi:hypothetical protein
VNATAWSGLIAGIVVAIIGAYGVVRTAKVARLSNDRMAAVEGWKEWRNDAAALRVERDALAAKHRQDMLDLGNQLRTECGIRAEQLAQELAIVETRLEGCVTWIRAVVPLMAAGGVPYPPIPRGITDTDPGLRPVRRP